MAILSETKVHRTEGFTLGRKWICLVDIYPFGKTGKKAKTSDSGMPYSGMNLI